MLRNAKIALFKLALLGAGALVFTSCADEETKPEDCTFGTTIECACPDGSVGAGLCGLTACDCTTADVVVPDGGSDADAGSPDADAAVTDTVTDTDTTPEDTTPATESICDDNLDDDLDGDVDCDDADCAADAACVESICNDDVDNDGDGDTDCDDSDCEGVAGCVEIICTDGQDNDGDTLVDCDDPDCAGDINCEYPPGWVAYTSQENAVNMALRIRSSDGMGEEYDIVAMGSQAIQGTAFSPDGRYLAYAYNGPTDAGVRILNLETGVEETVTSGGSGLYRHPSWHPTDFAILYSAGGDPNSASIWSYDLDTDTLGGPYASSDATGEPPFFVQGPAWNADATAIYVVAGVPGQTGEGDTRSDLAVLEGAGTDELRFITTNIGAAGSLAPNADNTEFLFHLGTGGCQTIDPSNNATALVSGGTGLIDCSYLGDDRIVGADNGNPVGGDARVLTVEGRPLVQLTQTGALRELNTSASSVGIDAFEPYFVTAD